jgi:hypothetical protein
VVRVLTATRETFNIFSSRYGFLVTPETVLSSQIFRVLSDTRDVYYGNRAIGVTGSGIVEREF